MRFSEAVNHLRAAANDIWTPAGEAVFRRIQAVARSTAAKSGAGAPTQAYLVRHTLESFLDRLTRTRTSHAADFVLKVGVLLAEAEATSVRPRSRRAASLR